MDQTGPGTQRPNPQIKPPPVSQHLREFAGNRQAWVALGRNLIPVMGIYLFGWSAALCVFSYWFDGLTALMAIVTAMVPRAIRESAAPAARKDEGGRKKEEVVGEGAESSPGVVKKVWAGMITWVFLVGIVGLPYWIVLIPLHDLLLGAELRRELAGAPVLWLTFGMLAAGHFWKAFRSGYDTMPDKELKQRARWDVYLLVLRAVAMFIMAAQGLAFVLVPLMALVLTYFEVWPERVLGAVFGDPKRLWEYDPEKGRK